MANVSGPRPHYPSQYGANSPIVTSGGRRNTQHEGVEVELPEARILPPIDLLELGRLILGELRRLSVGLLLGEETHVDYRGLFCRAGW